MVSIIHGNRVVLRDELVGAVCRTDFIRRAYAERLGDRGDCIGSIGPCWGDVYTTYVEQRPLAWFYCFVLPDLKTQKAIKELIYLARRLKLGYKQEDKCYSMMFCGPSGVGKSKICKFQFLICILYNDVELSVKVRVDAHTTV